MALFTILAMLLGFLGSRSIASVGMFLFGINALRDVPPKKWLTQRWYLLGLLWVGLFALSWYWSADKGEWGAHFQVKLPYLFLPLAFGFVPAWKPADLRVYTVMLVGCMLAGCCYSLSFFLKDPQAYIAGYGVSHTLPTPAYRDHISFSTGIAATVAWCFYSWPLWQGRRSKLLVAAAIAFFMLYLHLLAARTGLLALYVFLIAYLLYYSFTKSWKRGLLICLAMVLGIAACYRFIPTFQKRIGYQQYAWDQFRRGERSGNYSDNGRFLSYYVAAELIARHPVIGVGCGDMLQEMGAVYSRRYPDVTEAQWLIPHNQFITVALAVGVPGALLFTWFTFAPLSRLRRGREGFFFFAVWLLLLVPLFTDPFLEVQFGVFVSLFFLLMQRSLLLQAGPVAATSKLPS